MANQPGIFIAIEGTDGSGKTTHFELLADKLRTAGYEVATFDFPQYDKPSSYFVKRYLGGAYGSADQVGPYTGSLFYSLDRYEAAPLIRQALADGKVVISNRFAGSNMAHQGTKFANAEQRRGFFIWLDNLEFQMLNIPRPDINLVLRVPADISRQLLADKDQPAYLGNRQDIHESDLSHLERSVEVYDDLCNLFPKDFSRIDCVRSGELLPIEAVHKLVWEKLAPLLPRPPRKKRAAAIESPKSASQVTVDEYTQNLPSGTIITNAGHDVLNKVLTGNGSVSVFTEHLPPAVVASVLAVLPESDLELDVVILKELSRAANGAHDIADSPADTMAFSYASIALENPSQLLLQHINSTGAGLQLSEQQVAATNHELRDKHGRFRYHVPPELNSNTKNAYCDTMDQFFETYGRLVEALSRDSEDTRSARETASAVLPLATTSAAAFIGRGDEISDLISNLELSPHQEARSAGTGLLEQLAQQMPDLRSSFLASVDQAEHAADSTQVPDLRSATRQMLKDDYDVSPSNAVALSDIWPRNELDLVADMLYGLAGKSMEATREQAGGWTYDQKYQAFQAYFAAKPGKDSHDPVLDAVRYSWDIVCDAQHFRQLQQLLPAGTTMWQPLSPRYGYDVPAAIEDAGLSGEWEDCFDVSLRLFSQLQQTGFDEQAGYAVLLGHKMRARVLLSGSDAARLFAQKATTEPMRHMYEKLAEKHPLLAEIFAASD